MRNFNIQPKEKVEPNAITSALKGHTTLQNSSAKVEYTTKKEQNKTSNTPNRATVTTIVHSEEEKQAIFHFNRDRRFTITE